MATMRSGFDVMDRVQEGDIIDRIDIIRQAGTASTRRR